MIAFVNGFGNVGGADAVPHFADEGSGVAQGVHVGAVGALADGADNRPAGNEYFVSRTILAHQTFLRHTQAGEAGMGRDISVDLFHEDGPVPDVAVRGERVAHFHQMHCLSLHAQVNGALAAGEAAAENNDGVPHLVFLQIVVIDDHHIGTVDARKRRNNGL